MLPVCGTRNMEQLLEHPVNLGIYPVIEASEWMSFQYRDTQDQLDQLPNQELHLVVQGRHL